MADETNTLGKPIFEAAERLPPRPPSKTDRTEKQTVKILRATSEDIHIGENTSFEGSFETLGTIFVDGQLTKARVRAAQLSIGPRGRLDGEVVVSRAEIGGSFSGRITVALELVLRSTANIEGEIVCAELVTHRGAAIQAQVGSHAGDGANSPAPESPLPAGKIARRKNWVRGAALGGAFTLGALAAVGTVGTFLLFRLAPLVMP